MKDNVDAVYAVYDDFKTDKVDGVDKKGECQFYVKAINTGRSHTTSYGNTYEIYEYFFYDRNDRRFSYFKGSWWIHYIKDPEVKHLYSAEEFSIVDPTGKYRHIEINSYMPYMVSVILRFIENLHNYKDWDHFDLQVDHDKLVKKIETFRSTGTFRKIYNRFQRYKASGEWEKVWALRDSKEIGKDFYELWIEQPKESAYDPRRYEGYY